MQIASSLLQQIQSPSTSAEIFAKDKPAPRSNQLDIDQDSVELSSRSRAEAPVTYSKPAGTSSFHEFPVPPVLPDTPPPSSGG